MSVEGRIYRLLENEVSEKKDVTTEARELLALREKATPGPWHEHGGKVYDTECSPVTLDPTTVEDAAFIAAAHRMADCIAGLLGEVEKLRDELERERMRLVACGVVAMANTPESATRCRDMHPDYWSPSCADVARMVDSEMALRAENEKLKSQRDFLVEEYERAVGCGPQGYLHAAVHLFNAITNAAIDAARKQEGKG